MDLFDDLPDPSNNASTNSTSACSQKEQIICKNHSNGDISKKRKMDDSESSEMPNTVRQKPTVKYKLFGYHAERQGEREEMQDCYVLLENFTDKVQGLHPSVDGRVMGVLEVSRSIGDGQFKKHGVSCIPDVKKCQLTDFDRYIILACDGLWKTFDGQECIEFTNKSLLECKGTEEEKVNDKVCARLANEAVLRLSADNVTVVLISIEKT